MSGQTTAAVGAVGAVVAAGAGGPLSEVFNELALVMAIMGAAGGLTRGLAIRLPWREVVLGSALGCLIASGFGVLAPHIVKNLFGIDAGGSTARVMAASAYIMGFGQDVVITWAKRGKKNA